MDFSQFEKRTTEEEWQRFNDQFLPILGKVAYEVGGPILALEVIQLTKPDEGSILANPAGMARLVEVYPEAASEVFARQAVVDQKERNRITLKRVGVYAAKTALNKARDIRDTYF